MVSILQGTDESVDVEDARIAGMCQLVKEPAFTTHVYVVPFWLVLFFVGFS